MHKGRFDRYCGLKDSTIERLDVVSERRKYSPRLEFSLKQSKMFHLLRTTVHKKKAPMTGFL